MSASGQKAKSRADQRMSALAPMADISRLRVYTPWFRGGGSSTVPPRTKFPDLAVKFPDVRNIFPVNQLREMYDKALRDGDFLCGNTSGRSAAAASSPLTRSLFLFIEKSPSAKPPTTAV
jgi:hypothetical protein